MVSMNYSWILSMKVLLVSAGFISLALGLGFSVPIAANGVPEACSYVQSWLKPPYLYLLINGIIITIAASSRFHDSRSALRSAELLVPPAETAPTERFEPFSAELEISAAAVEEPVAAEEVVVSEIEEAIVELRPVTVNGLEVCYESEVEIVPGEARDADAFVDWKFEHAITPEEIISPEVEVQLESQFPAREKPLVASRFGHRKANRSTPHEGARTLRVARAKKHETLESTWKMITEGRHVPLTRHMKKTDTWEQGHVAPSVDLVPKSETFKDRGREASLGQDELNRRVEAFIKKFNEEMRMQRQESMMNQYAQMMNKP